jgi:hypothetical protein
VTETLTVIGDATKALAPIVFRPIPTFSRLDAWLVCELMDVLASVAETSTYAEKGTARHRFFQRITELMTSGVERLGDDGQPLGIRDPLTLEQARELALAESEPEHYAMLEAIPVDSPAFRFDTVAAEVALALDLETGEARELGRGLERDYSSKRPTEIVGTIDRLGAVGTDGGYVGDYKGRSFKGDPAKAGQFLAAALAAARLHRWSWVDLEVLVQIGDEVFVRKARVDLVALDAFEIELQDRRDRALANVEAFQQTGRLPPAALGQACDYCDRKRYCPARGALVREVVAGQNELVQGLVLAGAAYLEPHAAAEARKVKVILEDVAEKIGEALKEYARVEPFPLNDGSGRWYGVPPDSTKREIGAGEKVAKVLAELFGEEGARAGVKVEATLGGIESAVKAYIAAEVKKGRGELTKKGTITLLRTQAEELLTARGLLVERIGGDPKVYKPKNGKG